jgi:hypothetical protein
MDWVITIANDMKTNKKHLNDIHQHILDTVQFEHRYT